MHPEFGEVVSQEGPEDGHIGRECVEILRKVVLRKDEIDEVGQDLV